ncbi:hypothetical protein DOTSEDRAFT_69552 [Dothistroma septosporum NZE10]|uniref:DSC E3 ubiquitin ligase complex subunit A n=1 Tax=Dothistroma septosporum (strain NZE10 / CBS 128990) TaxID=675120 RepID=N1PXD5_DOTSN|nr:hypothetical protein DOTSEDRAFT_69552 [Dothistroma septosporum NZE10]
MADRRGALIPLVILAWIFLQPNPAAVSPRNDDRPPIDHVIAEEHRSLAVVQNSSYDDAFGSKGHMLNLTGLRPERGYAWESFGRVKGRVQEHLEYSLGEWGKSALEGTAEEQSPTPLYSNVSGFVRGQWKRSPLQESVPIPPLNLSEYAPPRPFGNPGKIRPFDRNVTGDGGEATVRFYEEGYGDITAVEELHHGYEGNITKMRAELKITDAKSPDEWEVHLQGVYFVDIGQAVLTTTSDKFAGIFALPHLTLSEPTFTSSRALLNQSITNVIQGQMDGKIEKLNPWSSKSEESPDSANGIQDCDLVVYLQQMAPITSTQYSPSLLRFLEDELRFPTGAFVPNAPAMRFSMLVFSPDCGYVLESQGPPTDFAQHGNHLTGPKIEIQHRHSRHHLLLFTFAIACQLFLLMRQMREANTPSTRSRISFYTIAMLALGDGFTTMTFLMISLFLSGLWINLVGTGFLAFISVSFFGMRFLMDIWQVQAPERERRARAEVEEERAREERFQAALHRIRTERDARQAAIRAAAATATGISAQAEQTHANASQGQMPASPAVVVGGQTVTSPAPTTSQASPPGSLPLPATAPALVDTGATPVFMPSSQEGLEAVGIPLTAGQPSTDALVQARMPTFASLYTRFYLLLLASLFLSLNAMSWPAGARRGYFTILALIYLSFWIPQIHRNVQRNCRRALNWDFVLGQSIMRLVPFIYFYGYRHNVIFAEVNYYGLSMLAVWIWIQVVVLGSQELLGPRWFIRKDWVPPAYDYHPVLREDEEGATMPIGFSQANANASAPSSPTQERGSSPIARRPSIAKETKEKGKRIFDCAICMQDLEVSVVEAGTSRDVGLVGGVLARRNYMVTPCRHIFHSSCLEGWMKYRLQCPICRETLPPL